MVAWHTPLLEVISLRNTWAAVLQDQPHELSFITSQHKSLFRRNCIDESTVWQLVRKGESVHPIIPFSDIQINSTAYRFEGRNYGDIAASFFLVHTEPGNGPSLHTHPYEEVFIVQEGEVTFVVGTETLRVNSGNVVIVPPETPHKFTNSGTTPLRQLSIHPTKEIITTWLEE